MFMLCTIEMLVCVMIDELVAMAKLDVTQLAVIVLRRMHKVPL